MHYSKIDYMSVFKNIFWSNVLFEKKINNIKRTKVKDYFLELFEYKLIFIKFLILIFVFTQYIARWSILCGWIEQKRNWITECPKVTQKEQLNRNKVETLAQILCLCPFPFTHCWYAIKTKWWFCIAVTTAIQNLFPRIWEIICEIPLAR